MFHSNIKMLMKKNKATVRSLVASSGLSSTTLTKARSDEGIAECRLSTLKRIAGCLGVPVKALFDEVEVEDNNDTTERTKKDRLRAYNALHGRGSGAEKKTRTIRGSGKRRMGYSGG